MNTLQTAVASLFGVALVFSLPGLYFYTEGPPTDSSFATGNPSPGQASKRTGTELVEYDPVPVPDATDVPNTDFKLRELSTAQRREIRQNMLVDINQASQSQLERVPGIGPSTAKQIVRYRQQNGPYESLAELDKVSGIGTKTVDNLRKEVKISGQVASGEAPDAGQPSSSTSGSNSASRTRINIHIASRSQLQTINGFGPATAD